jgi:hypothetical protein
MRVGARLFSFQAEMIKHSSDSTNNSATGLDNSSAILAESRSYESVSSLSVLGYNGKQSLVTIGSST